MHCAERSCTERGERALPRNAAEPQCKARDLQRQRIVLYDCPPLLPGLWQSYRRLGLIVVTTRFSVSGDEQSDFEQRLRDGVQLLQQPPGLIRNEVHRPCAIRFEQSSGQFVPQTRSVAQSSAAQYEVKTWWRSLEDFEDWTQSPACQSQEGRRALQETFTRAELLAVHEVFIESPRSGQR
ncbi:MAG: hypothetical protein RL685_1765 [Pseudomonadota bacterium]